MLQETLGFGEEISGASNKMLPGWNFQSLEAKGRFGGLATRFKEGRLKVLNNWGLDHSLGVEVYSLELCTNLLFLNIYGPCQDRVPYWNNVFSKSFMENTNLLIGGDLYFSLGISETWGPSAHATLW